MWVYYWGMERKPSHWHGLTSRQVYTARGRDATTKRSGEKDGGLGATFRTIGQEPGWLLDITEGVEIVLVSDYGEHRESDPFVDPKVFEQERRTRFTVGEIAMELRDKSCTDSMSGEVFAVTVIVRQPGRTLAGCGRSLY